MIQIFGATHIGKVRQTNQDAFAYHILGDNMVYAVVCDGMGGEAGGNIASREAVQSIRKFLDKELSLEDESAKILTIMQSAMEGANTVVHNLALEDESLKGMGTTCVTAVVKDHTLYVGYVGDSRVYRMSGLKEAQLTHDHTIVQLLLEKGEITAEEALHHPQRHYITRALGVSSGLDVDYLEQRLESGDAVLICTDGFHLYFEQGSLRPLLSEAILQGSASPLIDAANDAGGSDNITAVMIVV